MEVVKLSFADKSVALSSMNNRAIEIALENRSKEVVWILLDNNKVYFSIKEMDILQQIWVKYHNL